MKRNQFGGTVGGPIKQNRVFFFGGYQGTTVRQDPADTRAFVPTAAMMAGDFTAVTSPQCRAGGQQLNLRGPFVNNRINPAQFSRPAVNIANKLPKTNDPCGLITYGVRQPNNEKQILLIPPFAAAGDTLFVDCNAGQSIGGVLPMLKPGDTLW